MVFYRFLDIDYLFVGPRLDTCRILTSRVRTSARGECLLLPLGVVKLLSRCCSDLLVNPGGFCYDDDRQLVQGGCGKKYVSFEPKFSKFGSL